MKTLENDSGYLTNPNDKLEADGPAFEFSSWHTAKGSLLDGLTSCREWDETTGELLERHTPPKPDYVV